jgi:5-methylcytosine-specific restriction endonuclease McrA
MDNKEIRHDLYEKSLSQSLNSDGLSKEQWLKIIESQENKCAMCGREFSLYNPPTKDHIVPKSKFGLDTGWNIQAVCFSCNARKGVTNQKDRIQMWLHDGEK